jgi:outer membrane murein-binding lipoprotein Lpp
MDQALLTPTVPARRVGWRTITLLALLLLLTGAGGAFVLFRAFGLGPAPKTTTLTLPVGSDAGGTQAPVVIVPAKGNAQGSTIDLDALSSREAALSAQLDTLEERTAGVGADAQAAAGNAARAEGMLVAFAARRALDRGVGLGYLEERLRYRFGVSQPGAVSTIVQAAREPVTLDDLRGGLDTIGPDLVTGGLQGGIVTSFRRELANLVSLHRAGTPSPLPADRLARARRLVESGRIEAALGEVARLPGAADAGRWTEAARRYIDSRHALDILEWAALAGQAAGTVAPPVARPTVPAATPTPAATQTPAAAADAK